MQMIITKIGYIIDQSYKIRCDMLICAGVREPSRSRNIPNNKVSRELLGSAANCLASSRQQIGPCFGEYSSCCWDTSCDKNDPCYD
jgi:hypothetical protein